MHLSSFLSSLFLVLSVGIISAQRITTIQLDGVQYFISRMNPYSPELNFFLAYQYCRSLGLQLASFETKEKADSITQYLMNAGYTKYDFWVSGNKLGTNMYLWMSTGLPFNATFNYMKKSSNDMAALENATYEYPSGSTSPQRTARESGDMGLKNSCVAMKAPSFEWEADDCTLIKDFICEQTRCYYYNYGSIPVSSAQGKPSTTPKPFTTTTEPRPKYVPLGINELLSKMKLSTHSPLARNDESNKKSALSPIGGSQDIDPEQATNGPYDSYNFNAEMRDDPSAIVEHLHKKSDNYVSTIEPEHVTTLDRSSALSLH